MASTREIRMRIRAVQNIQKITRAMQMVAASRLKRAQDTALAAGPYSEKMAFLARELSRASGTVRHPLLETRPVEKRLVIGITSDKGLCGAYNTNVIRKVRETVAGPPKADVFAIGKKLADNLRFRGVPAVGFESMPSTGADLELVQRMTRRVVQWYTSAEYDQIELIYAQFRSAVTQVPTAVQLLPLVAPETSGGEESEERPIAFIFEPSAEVLLPLLVEKFVQNQFYRGLVDAYASELGARMVAMKNATDNADEVITNLRLTFNRTRQAAITKEILEVVSGAEALAE